MEPGGVLVCTALIIEISKSRKSILTLHYGFLLSISKAKKKKKKVKARIKQSTERHDMCFHSFKNLIFYVNTIHSIRISFLISMRPYIANVLIVPFKQDISN